MTARDPLHDLQSRLDDGRPIDPALDAQLDAEPALRAKADALTAIDADLRAAAAAVREAAADEVRPLELDATTPAHRPAVLATLGRPAFIAASLAAAALVALAALLSVTLASDPRPPLAEATPLPTLRAPSLAAVAEVANVPAVDRVAQMPTRVSQSIGRVDTIEAAALRSAQSAIESPYRAEARRLLAAFSGVFPALTPEPAEPAEEPAT
ncbi:MAG: hypothetical protein AAF823_05555 [Planctomycetota bacterium]